MITLAPIMATALRPIAYRMKQTAQSLPREFWLLAENGPMLLIETEHGVFEVRREVLEAGLRQGTVEMLPETD